MPGYEYAYYSEVAWRRGNYIQSAQYFGMGLLDMATDVFTMGYGRGTKLAAKHGGKIVGKGLKKGHVYVKGVGKVGKDGFHRQIKPKIIKEVEKLHPNYMRFVGGNPDIHVKGGKIILQGTQPGFTHKVFETTIDASKYF